MSKSNKHRIELRIEEYDALMRNPMIACMCADLLKSPRKQRGYVVFSLTEGQLEELTGWVAAESNHAKTREEEETLGEICDGLESILISIRVAIASQRPV